MAKYKRDEDEFLENTIRYIGETYTQHYVGKTEIQTIDVWESLDTLESTSRDTAIKYLMRYGKKDGKNIKDLMKAIHYITLMAYCKRKEDSQNLINEPGQKMTVTKIIPRVEQ